MGEESKLRDIIGAEIWDNVDARELAKMHLGVHRAVWRDDNVWFVCPMCARDGHDRLNVKVDKSGFWCFDSEKGGTWFDMLSMLGLHGNDGSMNMQVSIQLAVGHPANTPERNACHLENARRMLLMYVTK